MELPFLSDEQNAMAAETKERIQNKFLTPRIIIPVFAAIVALLLIGSIATLHREKKQQNTTTQQPSSETEMLAESFKDVKNLDANVLVAFTDSSDKKINMLGVLHIDSEDGTAEMEYIEPSAKIKVNNFDGTMQEHYEYGGASELIWAVRETKVTQIDRYIITDNDNLTSALKQLGETEITIDKNVNYNYKGINFIIEEGTQKLTADMLQKYLTYLCDEAYHGGAQKLSDMLAYLLSKFLTPGEDSTVEEMFNDIINYISTDISALDLSDYASVMISMLGDNGEMKIETKESL